MSEAPLSNAGPRAKSKVVACSDCFRDLGLRRMAQKYGSDDSSACPCCGAAGGAKLDRSELEELCAAYFVRGSVPTGRGIFAPLIQVNDRLGSSDYFGTAELNQDIRRLADDHGISCFYYGPPLWQFGKPAGETGEVEWLDGDLNYIVDYCPDTIIADGTISYRVRLNLAEEEILPAQFCTPPDEFRTSCWRFDSQDVPICYAAFDVETCLHETRVTLQDEVIVASLKAERSLRVLDLSQCGAPANVTMFEDPSMWLRSLLFDGADSYGVCRRLAKRILERGYDGFTYTSFFQQAAERPHRNLALFGAPVRNGVLAVASIDKVRLNNVAYGWQYGPVVLTTFG